MELEKPSDSEVADLTPAGEISAAVVVAIAYMDSTTSAIYAPIQTNDK